MSEDIIVVEYVLPASPTLSLAKARRQKTQCPEKTVHWQAGPNQHTLLSPLQGTIITLEVNKDGTFQLPENLDQRQLEALEDFLRIFAAISVANISVP